MTFRENYVAPVGMWCDEQINEQADLEYSMLLYFFIKIFVEHRSLWSVTRIFWKKWIRHYTLRKDVISYDIG